MTTASVLVCFSYFIGGGESSIGDMTWQYYTVHVVAVIVSVFPSLCLSVRVCDIAETKAVVLDLWLDL